MGALIGVQEYRNMIDISCYRLERLHHLAAKRKFTQREPRHVAFWMSEDTNTIETELVS